MLKVCIITEAQVISHADLVYNAYYYAHAHNQIEIHVGLGVPFSCNVIVIIIIFLNIVAHFTN